MTENDKKPLNYSVESFIWEGSDYAWGGPVFVKGIGAINLAVAKARGTYRRVVISGHRPADRPDIAAFWTSAIRVHVVWKHAQEVGAESWVWNADSVFDSQPKMNVTSKTRNVSEISSDEGIQWRWGRKQKLRWETTSDVEYTGAVGKWFRESRFTTVPEKDRDLRFSVQANFGGTDGAAYTFPRTMKIRLPGSPIIRK